MKSKNIFDNYFLFFVFENEKQNHVAARDFRIKRTMLMQGKKIKIKIKIEIKIEKKIEIKIEIEIEKK